MSTGHIVIIYFATSYRHHMIVMAFIAMTSQWAGWCHKSLASRLFTQRLFGCRSKKTSKPRVTGLCAGNSPGTGEFPVQMASTAETVCIRWCHHVSNPSNSTACSTACSGWQQSKYQRSTALAQLSAIHWGSVDSPDKGPVMQKRF